MTSENVPSGLGKNYTMDDLQRLKRQYWNRRMRQSPIEELPEVLTEVSRVHDQGGDTLSAIASLEDAQLVKAVLEAQTSIVLKGRGQFYKLPSGGWRGPGGNYGSNTPLGRELDAK